MSTSTGIPNFAQSPVDQSGPLVAVPNDLTPYELLQDVGIVDPNVREVDAVVLGHEPRPSLWRRIAARAAIGVALGGLGLGAIVVGVVLTATIVGAIIGVPMILLGVILCGTALLASFSQGQVQSFVVCHWPRY